MTEQRGSEATTPHVVIVAGSNGAGKSTAAPSVLRGALAVSDFVDRAINFAIREAVLQHKRAGSPIAVWSRGKVVWIQPKDI